MFRLRILEKCPAPWLRVGRGPLSQTSFPQLFRKMERALKFSLSSDCQSHAIGSDRTRTQLIDCEREHSRSGSLSRITGTVAPGKQCAAALKK